MKKIDLANEIATLENDIRNYRGQETLKGDKFAFIAKTAQKSKAFLENEVERLTEVRKNAEEDYYREAFGQSDEGKALHEKLEKDRDAWMADAYQQVLATVQELLGDDWTVAEWDGGRFKVGMKNTDPEAPWRVTKFGHDFEVYYGGGSYDREFEFKANIGTLGSFDIAEGDSQLAYYIGIGKFLASPKVQTELRDELKQLCGNIREIRNVWKRAKDEYVHKALKEKVAILTA